MPRNCCVPGCKSNYNKDGPLVPVFIFPKNQELREKWIRCIHREHFRPSKDSAVCIKHFAADFVIREDKFPCDDGSFVTVPRKRIKLQDGAFPTIFENQPAYLTKQLPPKRKDPSERMNQVCARDQQQFEEWNERDNISGYCEFVDKLKNRNVSPFILISTPDSGYVSLCKIDDMCVSEPPKVTVCIKIMPSLSVHIFHNNTEVPKKRFEWCLGEELLCDKWTKFDCLLSHVAAFEEENVSTNDKLSVFLNWFENTDLANFEDKTRKKLVFLREQLQLAVSTQPRYSSETLFWASILFYSFPGAYRLIQTSKVMTLPHTDYLRRLLCKLGTNNMINSSQVRYLIGEHERIVSILLDEIYVTPKLSYKGGKIEGIAINKEKEVDTATTIQAFMISSPLSGNLDVIALFPVKNINSTSLHQMTLEVLNTLETCGYTALCLISDNNRVNKGMFQHLCNGSLKVSVQNPSNSDKKLFLLFDSVHLLKCIRNNWLNAGNQIFNIPNKNVIQSGNAQDWFKSSINDSGTSSVTLTYFTEEAKFSDLIRLFDTEQNCLIKEAPALTRKALFPSSFERQNVCLALKIFDDKNIVALQRKVVGCPNEFYIGKVNVLQLITKWWKISNVKSPWKGKCNRDLDCNPIQGPEDPKLTFLEEFSLFLKVWHSSAVSGKLTNETHVALTHTLDTFVHMCKYIFCNFKWKYVLAGKFQTDKLEGRFGQYRQMSGGNYHISVEQVLESERKLKVCSVIKLKSALLGECSITSFVSSCSSNTYSSNENVPSTVVEKFEPVIECVDAAEIDKTNEEVIVCIGGYVAHSVLNTLKTNREKCATCTSTLSTDRNLIIEYDPRLSYLDAINRGGLKCPSDFVIHLCLVVFKIFTILVGEKYEKDFLHLNCQRKLVVQLAMLHFELHSMDFDQVCQCGLPLQKLVKKCCKVLSNIFLNNYCKLKNEKLSVKTKGKLQRKACKFSN